MINKLLCFMWGHTWIEVSRYIVVTYQQFFNYAYDKYNKKEFKTAFIVYKCKHCGAKK